MLANTRTPLNVKCTLIKLVTQGKVGIVNDEWCRRWVRWSEWRGDGGSCGDGGGSGVAVAGRGGGDRVDRVMGRLSELGRKTSRNSFPVAGGGGRRRLTGGGGRKGWPEKLGGREECVVTPSDIQYFAAYSDLRVLQIGIRAKPVAPPSPDYIPGPEDPQTPPVPQDEDEREPMFIQAHDPDYVPEPIYPEYIPLEDDHEFPAEEQPLPPIDSPTTESPGYVTESDPEEDPEEYEDDETEDGPVDYPMDGGDDGDDDDGDSSRDDARDEDEDEEDEEDEEEEEHLAPADSTTVIPADEPVFPPEGTEPVIPPPSTDITIGARITVRPQTSISLPPEAEVERLLTMTTPSPSPPISLSPPSAGERLARCTAPPAHSPPLPPSSGCLTQIQTLRIASTQALIDAVTTALPPPPLPPLPPSLYIPPPVDRRDDIPESEQPPRKRLHLSTLGSRYEIGESSTTRPTRGRGIDYGFVSTIDAEERRQGIRDVGYGIRDTWVDPAEADLYSLLEDSQERDSMDGGGGGICFPRSLGSFDRIESGDSSGSFHAINDHVYAQRDPSPGTPDTTTAAGRQDQMVETLRVIRDMRQDERHARLSVSTLREGLKRGRFRLGGLKRWSQSSISVVLLSKIKLSLPPALCEIKKLEIELWNLKVKGNDVPTYTERFQELTLICTKFVANETEKVDDKYGYVKNHKKSVKNEHENDRDQKLKNKHHQAKPERSLSHLLQSTAAKPQSTKTPFHCFHKPQGVNIQFTKVDY
ncbi:hypothetical protein Tco_0841877 [Tanacetum coccineum]|uniref:Reverse transcriptase domain-containing protein n=1 Tax=Tanacetum coccineum TaxID=301880 RepID=A0ABQ5AXM2_9ASTR